MGHWQTSFRHAGAASARLLIEERHYRKSSKQAGAVLAAVESQRGITDKKLIRQANEYARTVLGSTRFAPWLHVYCAVSGRFAEGWIPSNYYGTVVSPLKNGAVGRLTDLKTLTYRILQTDALPDVAYLIGGRFYARDMTPVADKALCELLFARDDRIFFKANDSDQGRGLTVLRRPDVHPDQIRRWADGVFQAPIRQHAFFDELSPNATATVRITTVRTPASTFETRAAYLRVGRANDAFIKSANSFRIPVDRSTGVLDDYGYMHDWRRARTHPDTHARFAGQTLPRFAQTTALCQSLHASFPYLACVGWDVCVDRDDVVRLMEWNGYQNGIKFSEATTGPCFGGLGWETLWKGTLETLPLI